MKRAVHLAEAAMAPADVVHHGANMMLQASASL
ncbi:hypothetical protein HaLaN_24083, partial [Haematococcus lacustris]